MKCGDSTVPDQRGFTLVELIVTLIAAGILAAFFIHFMGTALVRSSNAVEMVSDEGRAEAVLEEIIADYVVAVNSDPDNALAAIVTSRNNNQYGAGVLMEYIEFDAGGNEVTPSSLVDARTLKVTVQARGNDLTAIVTRSRVGGDPSITY
ncbi:MAG: type II secretion system protein [Desulfobacterales bacterium]|nr:MAG: type II secretion system protein [Desulfobacterales bacterium]